MIVIPKSGLASLKDPSFWVNCQAKLLKALCTKLCCTRISSDFPRVECVVMSMWDIHSIHKSRLVNHCTLAGLDLLEGWFQPPFVRIEQKQYVSRIVESPKQCKSVNSSFFRKMRELPFEWLQWLKNMIFQVLSIKPLGRRKQGLPFKHGFTMTDALWDSMFPKAGGSTPWLKVHHHGMDGQDWSKPLELSWVTIDG